MCFTDLHRALTSPPFLRLDSRSGGGFSGVQFPELLKQAPLSLGQLLGHLDSQPNVKVPAHAAAERRQAFSTQSQYRIRLSAGWHIRGDCAVERRNFEARAEHCIDDIDRFCSVEISAVPFETWVTRAAHDDKEIARR